MKKIGIKLADGSFYPVLEEGSPSERLLDLTTAHNNQTKVMVDLYRSELGSMEDAEYVDSLQIENLIEHPNGEPTLSFTVSIDENNRLSAKMIDNETGLQSNATITLVSRTLEERLLTDEYDIKDPTLDGVSLTETEENALFEEPSDSTELNTISDNSEDSTTDFSDISIDDNIAEDSIGDIIEEEEMPIEESAIDLAEAEAFQMPEAVTEEIAEDTTEETVTDATTEDTTEEAFTDETAEDTTESMPAIEETVAEPELNEQIEIPAEEPALDDFEPVQPEEALPEEEPALDDFADIQMEETQLEETPSVDSIVDIQPEEEPALAPLDNDFDTTENLEDITSTLAAEPDLESLAEPTEDEDFDFETEVSDIRFNDEPAAADTAFESFDSPDSTINEELPDFPGEEAEIEEIAPTTEEPDENSTGEFSDLSADVLAETLSGTPDLSDPFEEMDAPVETYSETPAEETALAEETIPAEDSIADESTELPDMDFDLPDVSDVQSFDANSENTDLNISSDSLLSNDMPEPDLSFDTTSDSLEPFPEESTETEEIPSTTEDFSNETIEEDSNFSDFNLPDLDDTTQASSNDFFDTSDLDNIEDSSLDDLDFSATEDSEATDSSLDDFDLPDFDETPATEPAQKGLSFTGLYDKETELGNSAVSENEHGGSKAAVIICILCAIICVLATLFVLAIIPSKFNLFGKNTKANAEQPVAIEQPAEPVKTPAPVVAEEPVAAPEPIPEPVKEPEVPQAQEEEIVIIEKAEEVVPVAPPVTPAKFKDINYKIKWGDTLWDISDTYYKNPWRYKYIARYNGIKNPDYIISGTYISIPAEK